MEFNTISKTIEIRNPINNQSTTIIQSKPDNYFHKTSKYLPKFIVFDMTIACDLEPTQQSDNTIQHINPVSLKVIKTVQYTSHSITHVLKDGSRITA